MSFGKLYDRRSLLAIVVGMPFVAKLLIEDPLAFLNVRHVLLLNGGEESEYVSLLPGPASGFAKSSDDAITVNVIVGLEILELVVNCDLFVVDDYFLHFILRLVL